MKKLIGILLAALLCMMLALPAVAESEGTEDTTPPAETTETTETESPSETVEPTEEATEAPTEAPTEEPTEAPTEEPTEAPDEIIIAPAAEGKDGYKDLLMDTFKQTRFGNNVSMNAQIAKILYLDEITVTAENYVNIVKTVNRVLKTSKISDSATLNHYTDEDLAVASEIIKGICDELGLGYSIDPSNDSQNEYARVITITKNGKTLGKINSDAKTDLGDQPSIGWIIGGGVLIGAAAAFGIVLVVVSGRRKRTA